MKTLGKKHEKQLEKGTFATVNCQHDQIKQIEF